MAAAFNKSQLDKMSLQQLRDLSVTLEDYIPLREQEELAEAQAKLIGIAEKLGYSLDELIGTQPAHGKSKKRRSANGRRKTHALSGKKVAPKYRNPQNKKETWSGRGRPPLWIVAQEKKGKKRQSFLIK